MGRHHLKLPDHLYLSPPTTQSITTSTSSASGFSNITFLSSTIPYHSSSSAFAVGDKIPGFRASAAFLSTLRANINLDADSPSTSLTNTPDSLRPISMASSTNQLPPPSPSPLSQSQELDPSENLQGSVEKATDPFDGVPTLTTVQVTTDEERITALRLLADSVAQQRQIAQRAVLYHPFTLSAMVLTFGLVFQRYYRGAGSDWATIGTIFFGFLVAILASIRFFGHGYIEEAERVGTWKWLDLGRSDPENNITGESDDIFLVSFGEDPIGTLFLRGVRDSDSSLSAPSAAASASTSSTSSSTPKKRRAGVLSSKNEPVKGLIRGWTVRQRYRNKGVGTALLEDASNLCISRGWQGPEFASDHANSARLLPKMFLGSFEKNEALARKSLDKVKTQIGIVKVGGKKKR